MEDTEKENLNNQEHIELTEVAKDEEEQIEHTNEDINNLKNQIETLQDKILRGMAESENIRRRYEKMIEEAKEYAIVSFAKDLLSVIDNLHRALEYKDQGDHGNEAITNIITGVEMTKVELESIFKKHGICAISPTSGDKFDYNIHQAISQVPTDEYPQDAIVSVLQSGYQIKDRLLRPAIVAVSKKLEHT